MHEGKKDCRQVASRGSAELFLMILSLLVMIRIFKRNYSIRGGSARIGTFIRRQVYQTVGN